MEAVSQCGRKPARWSGTDPQGQTRVGRGESLHEAGPELPPGAPPHLGASGPSPQRSPQGDPDRWPRRKTLASRGPQLHRGHQKAFQNIFHVENLVSGFPVAQAHADTLPSLLSATVVFSPLAFSWPPHLQPGHLLLLLRPGTPPPALPPPDLLLSNSSSLVTLGLNMGSSGNPSVPPSQPAIADPSRMSACFLPSAPSWPALLQKGGGSVLLVAVTLVRQ